MKLCGRAHAVLSVFLLLASVCVHAEYLDFEDVFKDSLLLQPYHGVMLQGAATAMGWQAHSGYVAIYSGGDMSISASNPFILSGWFAATSPINVTLTGYNAQGGVTGRVEFPVNRNNEDEWSSEEKVYVMQSFPYPSTKVVVSPVDRRYTVFTDSVTVTYTTPPSTPPPPAYYKIRSELNNQSLWGSSYQGFSAGVVPDRRVGDEYLDYQLWSLTSTGGGVQLVNKQSGFCLDIEGYTPFPGARVVVWSCKTAVQGNKNQIFKYDASTHQFRSAVDESMVLDVAWGTDGQIVSWNKKYGSASTNQRFKLEKFSG